MSMLKTFAEHVSAELGYEGELNEEVLQRIQERWRASSLPMPIERLAQIEVEEYDPRDFDFLPGDAVI